MTRCVTEHVCVCVCVCVCVREREREREGGRDMSADFLLFHEYVCLILITIQKSKILFTKNVNQVLSQLTF